MVYRGEEKVEFLDNLNYSVWRYNGGLSMVFDNFEVQGLIIVDEAGPSRLSFNCSEYIYISLQNELIK